MIGSNNFRQNESILETRRKFWRNAHMVNAPADVAFARFCEMTPPRIGFLSVGIEFAKGVNESSFDDLIESLALFGCETGVLHILLRRAISISLCATLKSPQTMTGFFFSSFPRYLRKSGSQTSWR